MSKDKMTMIVGGRHPLTKELINNLKDDKRFGFIGDGVGDVEFGELTKNKKLLKNTKVLLINVHGAGYNRKTENEFSAVKTFTIDNDLLYTHKLIEHFYAHYGIREFILHSCQVGAVTAALPDLQKILKNDDRIEVLIHGGSKYQTTQSGNHKKIEEQLLAFKNCQQKKESFVQDQFIKFASEGDASIILSKITKNGVEQYKSPSIRANFGQEKMTAEEVNPATAKRSILTIKDYGNVLHRWVKPTKKSSKIVKEKVQNYQQLIIAKAQEKYGDDVDEKTKVKNLQENFAQQLKEAMDKKHSGRFLAKFDACFGEGGIFKSVDDCVIEGRPILAYVFESEFKEAAIKLIEKGANVNVEIKHKGSLLKAACNEGDYDLVKILLEHGANASEVDDDYCRDTLLHSLVCQNGISTIIQELCNYGANVNAQDIFLCTPLHRVCLNHKNPKPEVVKILLANGADVNARDKDGKTPLDLINELDREERGDVNIILGPEFDQIKQILEEHQTNINKAQSPITNVGNANAQPLSPRSQEKQKENS